MQAIFRYWIRYLYFTAPDANAPSTPGLNSPATAGTAPCHEIASSSRALVSGRKSIKIALHTVERAKTGTNVIMSPGVTVRAPTKSNPIPAPAAPKSITDPAEVPRNVVGKSSDDNAMITTFPEIAEYIMGTATTNMAHSGPRKKIQVHKANVIIEQKPTGASLSDRTCDR